MMGGGGGLMMGMKMCCVFGWSTGEEVGLGRSDS